MSPSISISPTPAYSSQLLFCTLMATLYTWSDLHTLCVGAEAPYTHQDCSDGISVSALTLTDTYRYTTTPNNQAGLSLKPYHN